jgi:hypothetical protein
MGGQNEVYPVWMKIIISLVYDGRLLRRVAVEAVRYRKGAWVKRIASCFEKFGWQDLGAESVRGMSEVELKGMLASIAWRRVKEKWRDEYSVYS